ncbi:MAG: Na+ dependent nucleoside transporter [Ichthyobacteriaceae bacterium]|nr:Na+ dependent nucleoside transporter [Ichthyobacteriaceae bacterium]
MKKTMFLIIMVLISLNVLSQNIEQKWILDDGEYLELNENGSFLSNLNKLDGANTGSWKLNNNLLLLNYATDSLVEYNVELTKSVLTLKSAENDIVYLLKPNKEKVVEEISTKVKPSQGFTFEGLVRGVIGLLVLLLILVLFSSNRKAISWKLVGYGIGSQIIIALLIQKVAFVQSLFEGASNFFVLVLDFTRSGSEFLMGSLMNTETFGFIFAFQVLPTIIFFSALTSVLFYLGIIQKIVYILAWVMTKTLKISGAESLSVAGNVFLGQTESPLMIKAFLAKMNKSEMLLVMVGGMATLAGGVLAAYVSFLGGDDPVLRLMYAKQLLMASIMAAPGAVVASKILMPQTEKVDEDISVSDENLGSNILEAMSVGTGEGLRLAVNVAAMLLVFVAFIAMFNHIVGWIGDIAGLNAYVLEMTNGDYDKLSLQLILGYLFAPLMYVIGVTSADITLVGRLLGEKLIMSEFIGYISLSELKSAGVFVEQKSIVIATFMLAGFANFASIGIQIGGIGSLAPSKRTQLAQFGMKALLGGSIASLISATIAGAIIG